MPRGNHYRLHGVSNSVLDETLFLPISHVRSWLTRLERPQLSAGIACWKRHLSAGAQGSPRGSDKHSLGEKPISTPPSVLSYRVTGRPVPRVLGRTLLLLRRRLLAFPDLPFCFYGWQKQLNAGPWSLREGCRCGEVCEIYCRSGNNGASACLYV